MDEKELIKRARNSMKAGKNNSEILDRFQKRGYKLAYADELLKKAKRPKKIFFISLIIILFFSSLAFSAYNVFFVKEKSELANPLSGYVFKNSVFNNSNAKEVSTYSEIEVSEEFVSYLLNEIGAWKLHKNPFTFEDPVINLKVSEKTFYSVLGSPIKTFKGKSDKADLIFYVDEHDLINAVLSKNPKDVFIKSINSGKSSIKVLASNPELFSKGYLDLYNSLKI